MNNVTVDLFISKDFENNKAIKKVSDNLTVLRCVLSLGKDQPKSIVFVKVTSKTNVMTELKAASTIRVNGFLAPVSYLRDDYRYSYTNIVANEITALEKPSDEYDYSFMTIPDDEELPFK